ncbi:MAG TPA: hypothetical protein PKK31_03890 [Elusimicrobiales bacterium]|nr:hypothetical protein [Elusimicrobiales bacterium]
MGYLTAMLLALPLTAQEPQPPAAVPSENDVTLSTEAAPGAAAIPVSSAAVRAVVSGEPPAVLAEAALCLETLRNSWQGSDEALALAISSAAAFIAAGTPRALPAAAGEALGAELTRMRDREASARALRDLARLRRALQDFFADKGGSWPASLDELVPDYLPAIPVLDLPGHGPSASVTYARGRLHDGDPAAAVTDSGGWLYFSDPASVNRGLALIDCSHEYEAGAAWRDR